MSLSRQAISSIYEPEPRKILIASTTLRDGLQTKSAAHIGVQDRVRIAQMEEQLGVDICEAGFPGKEAANSVRVIEEVAKNTKRMVIAAMCGSDAVSIKAAMEALDRGGVLAEDRAQLNVLLRPSRKLRWYGQVEQISESQFLAGLEKVVERVVQAHLGKLDQNGEQIKLKVMYYLEQAMDAFNENPEFVFSVCKKIVAQTYEQAEIAGIDGEKVQIKLSLCDTNGIAVLDDYPKMFAEVSAALYALRRKGLEAMLSTHTHNDLGQAVANTVAAVVKGGAGQVEVTMNALGEGPGNADLATVVAQLHQFRERFGVETAVQPTTLMMRTANLVANLTGLAIPVNTPIVGQQVSAKSTTAGIHFAAEQNAQRYAQKRSLETGKQVLPEQVYRALNVADWGNDGELSLNSEQGVDALRAVLSELEVYVSPEMEKKMFEEIRTGYERSRNVQEYLAEVLCQPKFVYELVQEVNRYNGVTYHLDSLLYEGLDAVALAENQAMGQQVKVGITKKSNGRVELLSVQKASSRGTLEAFRKALVEIIKIDQPNFNFDVQDYFEQKVDVDLPGHEEMTGAASVVVSTVLIKDNLGRVRRGFGSSTDSVESKAMAIMNGLALLNWGKDQKGKSLPPKK